MTRELKGRHVLLICIAAFGIIITANLAMLFAATGSYPGLVVKNAYVASQGWDERAAAQKELGWTATVTHAKGAISLALIGQDDRPVVGQAPVVKIGRPTTSVDDRVVELVFDGEVYRAAVDLPPGRWRVDVAIGEPVRFTAAAEILIGGN